MSAATPAIRALQEAGSHFSIAEYDHDPGVPSYGLEAAEKLGVQAERVFKTLIAAVDGQHCVAVIPVTCQLNLKSLARALHMKHAVMADPHDAMRITGYVVGGISPLGQRKRLITAIDETALLWDTVLVSGGRRGLDIELAPTDLVELTAAVVADIAN